MKQIEILIPLEGISTGETKVTIETSGYTGTACQDAVSELLGKLCQRDDCEIENKSEMFEEDIDGLEYHEQ